MTRSQTPRNLPMNPFFEEDELARSLLKARIPTVESRTFTKTPTVLYAALLL